MSDEKDIEILAASIATVSIKEEKAHEFPLDDKYGALKKLGAALRNGDHKNVCFVTGAGISVSAGIPDFRSPGFGLYSKLAKYNLPYPMAIFELGFFKSNPKPFCTIAKELMPEGYEPTPAHYFQRLLHDKGLLSHVFTQNIDGLEFKAGLPLSSVTQAHGGFQTAHCVTCNNESSSDEWAAKIMKDEIPICDKCGGLVKPDIIFFGENLRSESLDTAAKLLPKADLLIVMGTSLQVHPVASFISFPDTKCPRVLMNRERVGEAHKDTEYVNEGFLFDRTGTRDFFLGGNTDDGVLHLVHEVGWLDDLEALLTNDKHAKALRTIEQFRKHVAKRESNSNPVTQNPESTSSTSTSSTSAPSAPAPAPAPASSPEDSATTACGCFGHIGQR